MNFVAETPAAYAVGYSGAASRLLAASHVGPLAPGAPPGAGGLRLAPGASLCGWRDVRGVIRCNLIAVSTANSSITSLQLSGPAGHLEALLNAGKPEATYAALVCHPHPMYGGTLHNKVVFHAMKALNSFGFPVLRFNFRGAGLSQGEHDNGMGEVDDVSTALNWLEQRFHLPMIFAGFSFGAAVGLRAACPDPRVRAVIALGVPVAPADERTYEFDFLQSCAKPKLFISGARDQFGPRTKLEPLVNSLPDPKKLVFIEGADHFFAGRLRELREAIEDWIKDVLSVQTPP